MTDLSCLTYLLILFNLTPVMENNYKRIEIMLGWACNNNCIFCAETWNRKRSIKEKCFFIDKGKIISLLDSWRLKGADHVTFLGGEPTINKNILYYLAYAKKIGYKTIFIATNARMCCNEDLVIKLVNNGLNETSVSFHGPDEESHDSATQSKGSFLQTYQGLINLIKHCENVMVNILINKYNYKKLPDFMDLLSNLKLVRVLISYPIMIGNACDFKKLIPTYTELYKYIHKAIDKIKDKLKITIMNVPFCFLQGYEEYSDYLGYENRKILKINCNHKMSI